MNKKKRGGCRQGHVGGRKRVISRVLLAEEGPIAATALPLPCRRLVYNPSSLGSVAILQQPTTPLQHVRPYTGRRCCRQISACRVSTVMLDRFSSPIASAASWRVLERAPCSSDLFYAPCVQQPCTQDPGGIL